MHYYTTEEMLKMSKSLKSLAIDNNKSIDRKQSENKKYQILSEALNTDSADIVRAYDYYCYCKDVKKETPDKLNMSGIEYPIENIIKAYNELNPRWIPYLRNHNRALRSRKNRLKHHVEKLFDIGNCIFCTFTFTDSVLDSTSELTRRRYISRTLKKMGDIYIANIDYGEQNEREHYHAIVVADRIDMTLWNYGWILVRNCYNNNKSIESLSTYITKLTNHGLKKGTKYKHIIYSK